MLNDDLVKCPLCRGFTHIENPELLAALRDPKLRQEVERYVADRLRSPSAELAVATAGQPQSRDSNRDIHNWNPHLPVGRRSPKE
jgi:hypothetical protein